ncbi:MAG TPA: hypothetical protein VK157_02895 [Phycisphaerales bacterium]|nr:hypothetical protein [Phycisphaerales bacterium]
MQRTLTPENTLEFLRRFDQFNDGVLRKIEVSFPEATPQVVRFWLEGCDYATGNDAWVLVRLDVLGVTDFRLACSRKYGAVTYCMGISFGWFDGQVAVDVSDSGDTPQSLAQLQASSNYFAVGSRIEWSIVQE